jgi:hypothetical protein
VRNETINQRLIHDVAYTTARHLLQAVENSLRDEEKRDAFEVFYRAVKAGLEMYEVQRDRMLERLYGPRQNLQPSGRPVPAATQSRTGEVSGGG